MKASHPSRTRVAKFALVGMAGTGLDVIAFSICLILGFDSIVSRGIGYLAGTSWAFFLNRGWVFGSSSRWSRVIPFILTYIVSGLLAVLIQALGPNAPEPLSGVIWIYGLSVFIAATLNYFSLRHIVFRNQFFR